MVVMYHEVVLEEFKTCEKPILFWQIFVNNTEFTNFALSYITMYLAYGRAQIIEHCKLPKKFGLFVIWQLSLQKWYIEDS